MTQTNNEDKRQQYYKRLRKLTDEQLEEVYNLYYNYDPAYPQPTIKYLAHRYNVSLNAMFRALHNERLKRNKHD